MGTTVKSHEMPYIGLDSAAFRKPGTALADGSWRPSITYLKLSIIIDSVALPVLPTVWWSVRKPLEASYQLNH